MPDTPQPASRKRKIISGVPGSSTLPLPRKRQKTNSDRAALTKSAAPGTHNTTPSPRGTVRPGSPGSAPPKTKSHRSQQDAGAGSSSQPLPLRRRTRSTITVVSRKRLDSPDLDTGDDTPPPVTALRRSSSGRVIISTPKLVAANELGKPFGSAKPRQKRKTSLRPPDIIELYSSGEEERQKEVKGKNPPAKRHKKRKAAEVIDLCSDDEPSPSPTKTPIVRTCVDNNIVTILSSDDDKLPTRPTHGYEPHAPRTPVPTSLKRRKGQKNPMPGSQNEGGIASATTMAPIAQPSTQLDTSVEPLPRPALITSMTNQIPDPVMGGSETPEAWHNDAETGLVNVFVGSDSLEEGSIISLTISTTPLPPDDEGFQSPVSQSLKGYTVNHNDDLSMHSGHDDLLDTNSPSLPAEPILTVTTPHLALPTPEHRAGGMEVNTFGNAPLAEHSESRDSIPPSRVATPLFLPPSDDEEQDERIPIISENKYVGTTSILESSDVERAGSVRADDLVTDPRLIRLSSPSEIDANELKSHGSPISHRHSLEKAYAEEILQCRYQYLHQTPSYVDPNITYPSDPSRLLSHLRLHTPSFFERSFVLPIAAKEKEVPVEGRQGDRDINLPLPTIVTPLPSPKIKIAEPPTVPSHPVGDIKTLTIDAASHDTAQLPPSPVHLSKVQEVQNDTLLLGQEPHLGPTLAPPPFGEGDEVTMEVAAEMLEKDPMLASALLESKMFMDILRDVQQEDSKTGEIDGQSTISNQVTHVPIEAPDDHTGAPNDLIHQSLSKETPIGTPPSPEQVQNSDEQSITPEQEIPAEHGPPPSPSSLNSSGTLQNSPLPPTPKCEEHTIADTEVFFIRSESPSAFNPDAFAAILNMASPPPLAKEEDDYFSTHFFDYPDDMVA